MFVLEFVLTMVLGLPGGSADCGISFPEVTISNVSSVNLDVLPASPSFFSLLFPSGGFYPDMEPAVPPDEGPPVPNHGKLSHAVDTDPTAESPKGWSYLLGSTRFGGPHKVSHGRLGTGVM